MSSSTNGLRCPPTPNPDTSDQTTDSLAYLPLTPTTLLIGLLTLLNLWHLPPIFSFLPYATKQLLPWRIFIANTAGNPVERVIAVCLVFILSCLILLDLFRSRTGTRVLHIVQLVAVYAVLIGAVIWPMMAHAYIRNQSGILLFTHDGGVCYSEAAGDMICTGKNPYRSSYLGSVVEEKFRTDPFWKTHPFEPILDHNPYLPLPLLIGIPFRAPARWLFGFFDQRHAYVPLLLLLLMLTPLLFAAADRAAALALLFLNPMVSDYLIQGSNDLLLYLFLLGILFFERQRRPLAAGLCLGLACVTKQFAWFFVVPFLVFWLKQGKSRTEIRRAVLLRALPAILVATAIMIPFLIWDTPALIDDTLLFNFGLSGPSYPFGGTPGYGFAAMLVAFGIVHEYSGSFPLWILQLLTFTPLYLFTLIRLAHRPELPFLLTGTTVSMLFFLFFSRMFHFNYFGMLLFLLITAAFLAHSDQPERDSVSR